MACELQKLQKLSIYQEPNGSYGTDHSGTYGDFAPVPFVEGTLSVGRPVELLDPNTAHTSIDYVDEKIVGRTQLPPVKFEVALHSHGLDLDGDVSNPTVANWPLMALLDSTFGGSRGANVPGAQTTVQAGSTTTTINVTTGHGIRFAAGAAIACITSVGLETREVASVLVDAVTVRQAFASAPSAGTVVRAPVSFYLTEDLNSARTSLQAIAEGVDDDNRTVFRGLQATGGVSLALPTGEIGKFSFDLTGQAWARMSSGFVLAPTFLHYSPVAALPARLTYALNGASTLTVIDQASQSIELGPVKWAPVRSGNATNTILKMARQGGAPVKFTFTTLYDTNAWETSRAAKDDVALYLQLGNAAGSCVMIAIRKAQIVDVQDAAHDSAMAGQTVTLEARMNSASSTDIDNSVIALHFF